MVAFVEGIVDDRAVVAGCPRGGVDLALEGRARVVADERKLRGRVVGDSRRLGGDRGLRHGGVDVPTVAGRRRVIAPFGVFGPHVERVTAVYQASVVPG